MVENMEQNYHEEYTVNGELIFKIDNEKLRPVFEDFPNKGKLKELVKNIKGLYLFIFYITTFMFTLK